jgi:hypothetical protein
MTVGTINRGRIVGAVPCATSNTSPASLEHFFLCQCEYSLAIFSRRANGYFVHRTDLFPDNLSFGNLLLISCSNQSLLDANPSPVYTTSAVSIGDPLRNSSDRRCPLLCATYLPSVLHISSAKTSGTITRHCALVFVDGLSDRDLRAPGASTSLQDRSLSYSVVELNSSGVAILARNNIARAQRHRPRHRSSRSDFLPKLWSSVEGMKGRKKGQQQRPVMYSQLVLL